MTSALRFWKGDEDNFFSLFVEMFSSGPQNDTIKENRGTFCREKISRRGSNSLQRRATRREIKYRRSIVEIIVHNLLKFFPIKTSG
mmetsp:Transcript_2480/g.2597  ORF Transcript_2480/g.2597 Transcript_2480/m.2597 type:complete len:86 (-) Transcript_2480:394-651(-)